MKKLFSRAAFTTMITIALFAVMGVVRLTYADNTSEIAPSEIVQTRASPGRSQGPNPLGSGKVYYSDSNSFGPTTPFYEYDVATDTWTPKAPLPAANTTQLASDEMGSVYALPEDGKVYRYDPGTDIWVFVMNGPPASVGRNAISMFEAHNGEFYWGRDFTTTLYYTVGGVWNSIETASSISAGAAIDRGTGRVYIRTVGELGFFAFDPASATFPQICNFGLGVFENSRVGAFYNGEFFSRHEFGTYQAIDVSTCSVTDTGVAPTSSHSSTGEDEVGNIYSNGWNDDIVFEVFNVPTNTLTRLMDAPDIPDNAHSTLVAVGAVVSPPGVTCNGLPATIVGNNNNNTIFGTPGNDVIHGRGGNDVIYGLGGNDRICGGLGADQLFGNQGKDQLFGGAGNDVLKGGTANDRLFGQDGNDTMDGGLGSDDNCNGGPGIDTATSCEQPRDVP